MLSSQGRRGTKTQALSTSTRSLTDRASDYGSEGCRFESCRVHIIQRPSRFTREGLCRAVQQRSTTTAHPAPLAPGRATRHPHPPQYAVPVMRSTRPAPWRRTSQPLLQVSLLHQDTPALHPAGRTSRLRWGCRLRPAPLRLAPPTRAPARECAAKGRWVVIRTGASVKDVPPAGALMRPGSEGPGRRPPASSG